MRTPSLARRLTACIGLLALASAAWAQTYPNKPIRVIFPFPPGGGTDIIGRPVLEEVAKFAGTNFVIENRGGSNGLIGADLVAKAAPDGYTLLLHTMFSHLTNPSLYAKMPYDTERDFLPVTIVGSTAMVLVAHPSYAGQNLGDVIALAKASPGKYSYASFGSGSGAHLGGELFKMMAGVDIVHVPYKGGGPAIADTIAGHIPLHFAGIATALPHLRAGKLRALGVTSARRSKSLPDQPTFDELGLKGYEAVVNFGVLAPAGTPAPVMKHLEGAFLKALAQPELRQKLENQGNDGPFGITAEEFTAFIKAEIPKWAKVVRDSGAKVD